MSNRNFILIILITVILSGVGTYFYLASQSITIPEPTGDEMGDTGSGFPSGSEVVGTKPTKTPQNRGEEVTATSTTERTQEGPRAVAHKMTTFPVAGFVPVIRASSSAVRMMRADNGHILEAVPGTVEPLEITNTTISRVQDAQFGERGAAVLVTTLGYNNDKTFLLANVAAASSTKEKGSVEGLILPKNIIGATVSGDRHNLFTLFRDKETTLGHISDMAYKNKRHIFSSPFTEWLPTWTSDSSVLLTTKPSAKAFGYSYGINEKTDELTRYLADKTGLVAILSTDGKYLAYTETNDGYSFLTIRDVKSGFDREVELPTIADKCTWSRKDPSKLFCASPNEMKNSSYPDDWYQGIRTFSDSILSIDAKTGIYTSVFETKGLNSFDAIKLTIDKYENYLYFINKKDGTLWYLQIQ